MNESSSTFPQWPAEQGHMPEDVKQRINELLFYSLPPTTCLGDMETIAADLHARITDAWEAALRRKPTPAPEGGEGR